MKSVAKTRVSFSRTSFTTGLKIQTWAGSWCFVFESRWLNACKLECMSQQGCPRVSGWEKSSKLTGCLTLSDCYSYRTMRPRFSYSSGFRPRSKTNYSMLHKYADSHLSMQFDKAEQKHVDKGKPRSHLHSFCLIWLCGISMICHPERFIFSLRSEAQA